MDNKIITSSMLTSSSSMLSSDMYYDEDINSENSANESNFGSSGNNHRRKRSKKSSRVKYWTLPTMSSGTFNPNMLTERQQLQYLAQKSKRASTGNGENEDILEFSPLRLDRIKLEEMRSMKSSSGISTSSGSNNINTASHLDLGNDAATDLMALSGSSPVPLNRRVKKSSKLKREILELPEELDSQDQDQKEELIPKPLFRFDRDPLADSNDEFSAEKICNDQKMEPPIVVEKTVDSQKKKGQKAKNQKNKNQKVLNDSESIVSNSILVVNQVTQSEISDDFEISPILVKDDLKNTAPDVTLLPNEYVMVNEDVKPDASATSTPFTTTNTNTTYIAESDTTISTMQGFSAEINTTSTYTPSKLSFLKGLSTKVQTFLSYSDSIRQKHLSALLASMAARKGLLVDSEEIEIKRKEIEAKHLL